jgi:hypothetical protein
MSETLHWIELIISSGLVITVGRLLIVAGRMQQKQEDHDQRIGRIEGRLDFPRYPVHGAGR